jgi:hypothetical protein
MAFPLSELALNRLNRLKMALNADESAILEQAINHLYENLLEAGAIYQSAPIPLAEVLDRANLLKSLYRCTRNSLTSDGADSIPLILEANTEEEAWQKMALLFPSETAQGFTIQLVNPLNL